MSQELRDLAKKVMDRVELAVNREDEAFRKALQYLREEIKAILGEEGDTSVGEAQSPNPTVAAPIWAHMGGPQPANATSPNAPMRNLGEENADYSEQMPGNGQPELAEGQEPSASIPNAQAPISADTVAAIAGDGAAATSGLGAEMAHNADSPASPEGSATVIQSEETPDKAPEAPIAGGEGSTPDSGEGEGEPLPSEAAIQGADAGTAVQEQKDAEAVGNAEGGPLAEASAGNSSKIPASAGDSEGLPQGGNSPETAPLEKAPMETDGIREELDAVGDEKEREEESEEGASPDEETSPDEAGDEAVGSGEETSPTGEPVKKKRGRPKKS